MNILCKVCDRWIIENESESKDYLTFMWKKNDESVYNKYTINNINLDENDKKIN